MDNSPANAAAFHSTWIPKALKFWGRHFPAQKEKGPKQENGVGHSLPLGLLRLPASLLIVDRSSRKYGNKQLCFLLRGRSSNLLDLI